MRGRTIVPTIARSMYKLCRETKFLRYRNVSSGEAAEATTCYSWALAFSAAHGFPCCRTIVSSLIHRKRKAFDTWDIVTPCAIFIPGLAQDCLRINQTDIPTEHFKTFTHILILYPI